MRTRMLAPAALLLLLAACGSRTNNTTTQQYSTASQAATAPSAATGAVGAAAGDPAARNGKYTSAPEMQIDPNKTYTATIETTDGTMTAELFAKEAPKTVNSFVFLARDGFYQDVKFHRIIKGFMVQTGDPTGTGTGGPGYEFEDEPIAADRSYTRGTIAMANAGPNTNGSQFFIMHQDYALGKNYTIFGQVTEGLDVVDKIADTPTTGSEGSTPTEDVRIVNITIAEQ